MFNNGVASELLHENQELHQVAIKLLTYGLLYLMTTRLQIQRDQHRQQQYHVKAQGKLPHILC